MNLFSDMADTPKEKEKDDRKESNPIAQAGTPKLGPFETFVAGNGAGAFLDLDTPAQNNAIPRDIRKREPEEPKQGNVDGNKVQRKKRTTGGADPKPKAGAKPKATPKKSNA